MSLSASRSLLSRTWPQGAQKVAESLRAQTAELEDPAGRRDDAPRLFLNLRKAPTDAIMYVMERLKASLYLEACLYQEIQSLRTQLQALLTRSALKRATGHIAGHVET